MDAAQDPARVEALRAAADARGLPLYPISSVTGQGVDALKFTMAGYALNGPNNTP